jgi:DNA-binding protein H-NS
MVFIIRNVVEEFLKINQVEKLKRANKEEREQRARTAKSSYSKIRNETKSSTTKPQPTPSQYFKSKSGFIFESKIQSWKVSEFLKFKVQNTIIKKTI